MVQLTRLNHLPLVLNSDLIEYIEITPDTVITLTTGQKIMVRESATEVVDRVVAFRRSILNGGVASPILSRDQQEGASLESEPA
jgi:flagellar protein FlbD